MVDLFELLKDYGSSPIFESEIMTSLKERFVVFVYKKTDENDRKFISENRALIKTFMDSGYQQAGLGDWFGCANKNAVKQNTVLLKIARTIDQPNHIVAMSVYTAHPSGIKCVGITRLFSNNEKLTHIAKEAVKYIIKDDICKADEFRWIECSGSIEHYYEKFGADMIKVPNIYLPLIFNENELANITIEDREEYNYIRYIKAVDLSVHKCIFGFPNQSVIDKMITERNQWLDDFMKKLRSNIVLEHMFTNVPSDINNSLKVMDYFIEIVQSLSGFEITEYEMSHLTDAIDLVRDFMSKNSGRLNNTLREDIYDKLDCASDCANSFTILKPYAIGEEIITERNHYIELNQEREYL